MANSIEQRINSIEETLLAIRNVVNNGLVEVGRMKKTAQQNRPKSAKEKVADIKAMILEGKGKPTRLVKVE